MRKILWMIISGISLSLIPAMAQFNTVSSASDHYREESVQAATKDKETASDNTGSGKVYRKTPANPELAAMCKGRWWLSVT